MLIRSRTSMFCKLAVFIVFCSIAISSITKAQEIDYSSRNADSTDPNLRVIGLGSSNVTFKWTRTGAWMDVAENNFNVSLLPRDGAYRPIEYNYSFTQHFDFYYNVSTTQANYVCDAEACECSFTGHLQHDSFGRYYKACSDGVIVVKGGELQLKANFTTAPSTNLDLLSEIDGNNIIVHYTGFNKSEDGICGQDILLNVYQPVENDGFYPSGWYWPGANHYGDIVHQKNLSIDTNTELEFTFALDPEIPNDDDPTSHSVGAVMAYMDGDIHIVTNTWSISVLYYEGSSSVASISTFTIILTSLFALSFN